jgi:hypothetical protein
MPETAVFGAGGGKVSHFVLLGTRIWSINRTCGVQGWTVTPELPRRLKLYVRSFHPA